MNTNILKLGYFLSVAACLCACNEKPEPVIPEDTVTKLVFSASLPDTQTKTSLSSSYDVLWNTGDKISVNGVLSNAVSSADDGKESVDFIVEGSLSAPFKVLYPGTASNNVITLPAVQSYVAGSFDPAAAASYGTAVKNGNKYNVSLTSFCGIIRFALNGSATLDRIEINSLGSEKLYGPFTLETDSDGFTGVWSGGTAGTLTYDCDVTLSASNTYLYIALPAQTYASGLEALVYQADGAYMRLKFWGDSYSLEDTDLIGFESKTFAAGRTENLFDINDLTAENGGEPTAAPPGITVATYNVFQEDSREEDSKKEYMYLSNENVRIALGTAIAGTTADIIGFNELDPNFQSGGTYSLKTIAENQGFTGYTWELSHPDDIKDEGTFGHSYKTYNKFASGFAYKTALFDISDHNYVWLSHKASNTYYDSRSSAYGNCGNPETTCVYAKFTHKVSGKQFYLFVTHMPTLTHTYSELGATKENGEYSDEDQAAAAARRLRVVNNLKYFTSQKAGSLPYIVVGDFNYGPYIDTKKTQVQPLYTAMTSGGFTNAYDEVYNAGNLSGFYINYPGTLTGSNWGAHYLKNGIYPQFRIDHIFLHDGSSQTLTAQSYRTIRTTYDVGEDTWCPSDHFPVVSYVTFD